jgi:hypothetical protein
MDKIQAYRQPLVTSTGILLGFILNFASSWATNAFTRHRFREVVVAIAITTCIIILLIVLYRILNIHYPKEQADKYYKTTLVLFIIGVAIPFIAILITLIDNFIENFYP